MRQKRFADAVLSGVPSEEAYRTAGYREKDSHEQARRLLRSPAVQAYMEQKKARDSERTNGRSDELLCFLAAVLRGEHGNKKERMRAAELLGKRQGLFGLKTESEIVIKEASGDDSSTEN